MTKRTEAWLRGPVEGVPPLLQPVVHSVLQVREELAEILVGFPDELLWERPAGVASVGFHLQHIAGVLDRLFTYARGEALAPAQIEAMRAEGVARAGVGVAALLSQLGAAVDRFIEQVRALDEGTLTQPREVGRAKLPSTVQGLLFHAAEHSQRHLGQLLVTARVLRPDLAG